MKAIMLMFDSLKRDWLPPYGGDIIAPNFDRLENHTVVFENFYTGSMSCMPARRELHTGRYNFLHKGWSPLEPFDDSMPELLRIAGIHTHLISDHHHYWREGGGNYHARYSTYEHVRGQEGDPWKGEVNSKFKNTSMMEQPSEPFANVLAQDSVNRKYMADARQHSQTKCFNFGMEFLATNHEQDNWFLTVECFDPHEPFFTYDEYKKQYPSRYQGRHIDWPLPSTLNKDRDYNAYVRYQYKALVTMIDKSLGRILDAMDEYNMWEDTMLIVNTDHGLLLGEHNWWSKGTMPPYNEIARLPFFIWDPRLRIQGERRQALAQNIDVCATLLNFFGQPLTRDMKGRSLAPVVENDSVIHDYILYGYFGGSTNITDGQYTYMRGPVSANNAPLYEYTLIPARMNSREDLQDYTLQTPFEFTKGCQTLKIDKSADSSPVNNMYRFGNRIYDLKNDPGQQEKLDDIKTEKRLIGAMIKMMRENEAPADQYERLGLWSNMTEEVIRGQRQEFEYNQKMNILTQYNWDIRAANQFKTIIALIKQTGLQDDFVAFADQSGIKDITPDVVYAFANAELDKKQAAMLMMMLNLSERID